jgi:hypothetical protein
MIYKKKKSEVTGLWCRKDKKFYYLETGIHSIRNPLDRIKNSLISRGILEWDITGTKRYEEPVLKMTWAEAEERGYESEPIYLNQHVENQIKQDRAGKLPARKNPWKKLD